VHDDAGRLVYHQQVLVLPGDPEWKLLPHQLGRAAFGQLERELLPAFEPVALRPDGAVDERGTALEQSLRRRARADLGQRGEEAVEPPPSSLCGNYDSKRAQSRASKAPLAVPSPGRASFARAFV